MLFQSKRNKVLQYLEQKKAAGWTPFDELLRDWAGGDMEKRLREMGLTGVEIHLDWLADYQCLGIQGKYQQKYVDLQIEPRQVLFAYDPVEPDEPECLPLESKEQVYALLNSLPQRNT